VQTQTQLANTSAPTAFDTFAWANYAPEYVECENDPDTGAAGEIYFDQYLGEDPGTGKLIASADAWVGAGFIGADGTEMVMAISLYDSSGSTDAARTDTEQGGGSVSATTNMTSRNLGDTYTSDGSVTADAYNDDSTVEADADGKLSIQAVACSPAVQRKGIRVDGLPTSGFMLGKSVMIAMTGQCLNNISQITAPLASG
jgi:hypothetical protein